MFITTVDYKDFNDVAHKEKIHFNLLGPEIADLEFNPTFQSEGGLGKYITSAVKNDERLKMYTFFKLLVVNSYGRRSEDGARFSKNPEWTQEFLESPAWETFFFWLVRDPKNAETFWDGIFPAALIKEIEASQPANAAVKKDIKDMSKEELQALYVAKLAEKKPANES